MSQWWWCETIGWKGEEASDETTASDTVQVMSNDESDHYLSRLPAGVEEPIRGGYHEEEESSSSMERFETILMSSGRNTRSQNHKPKVLTVCHDMTETEASTSSSSDDDDDEEESSVPYIKPKHHCSHWIKQWIHRPILRFIRTIASISALHPIRTIGTILVLSTTCLIVGLCTNFRLDLSPDLMWTPIGSNPVIHQMYMDSTFSTPPRRLSIFFHADGTNVIAKSHIRPAFDVMDIIQNNQYYDTMCSMEDESSSILPDCILYGLPKFWGNDRSTFDDADESNIQQTIRQERFPDFWPVQHDEILGHYLLNETHVLSAESYTLIVSLPDTEVTRAAELEMVQEILQWNDRLSAVRIEVIADDSITQELIRSIHEDIPLVPVMFIAMSLYTMLVFARRDKVFSRSGLGLASIIAVVSSLATGFGLLFWIGVPFTPITQLLPFLIFSLGLDDCFIIMGAYARTDPRQSAVDRIDATLVDIGLSITLTTLTTATAFGLGCFSSIPAIYWLCQYCAPTIVIVFFYQITFFVACIALDEQRIRNGRFDLLCCGGDTAAADCSKAPHSHFGTWMFPPWFKYEQISLAQLPADHMMEWYANQLLRPSVRILAMLGFLVLYGFACYGASEMTQNFSIAEVLPRDSYVGDYLEATSTYRDASKNSIQVVFRDVDQANPFVRAAMIDFTKELGEMDFIEEPAFDSFWMTQFDLFLRYDAAAARLSFNEALDRFLENPLHQIAFGNDIVRSSTGEIIASRVHMTLSVSEDVHEQIRVLDGQHTVSLQQPINYGRDGRLSFFTFAKAYTGFENYSRGVRDLISTAITGVIAVTFVAVVFIPHWSAALVICPLIIVLYIELLGVMQWGGLHLNSMTAMSMTISIGLLVDFVVHILFRYYEEPGTRQQKTVAMLRTMGSSVLLGGTTTLLGTLPLIFASSDALQIVFVSFLGIVSLGVGHGLILLPVLLSTYGPEDPKLPLKQIRMA